MLAGTLVVAILPAPELGLVAVGEVDVERDGKLDQLAGEAVDGDICRDGIAAKCLTGQGIGQVLNLVAWMQIRQRAFPLAGWVYAWSTKRTPKMALAGSV